MPNPIALATAFVLSGVVASTLCGNVSSHRGVAPIVLVAGFAVGTAVLIRSDATLATAGVGVGVLLLPATMAARIAELVLRPWRPR